MPFINDIKGPLPRATLPRDIAEKPSGSLSPEFYVGSPDGYIDHERREMLQNYFEALKYFDETISIVNELKEKSMDISGGSVLQTALADSIDRTIFSIYDLVVLLIPIAGDVLPLDTSESDDADVAETGNKDTKQNEARNNTVYALPKADKLKKLAELQKAVNDLQHTYDNPDYVSGSQKHVLNSKEISMLLTNARAVCVYLDRLCGGRGK